MKIPPRNWGVGVVSYIPQVQTRYSGSTRKIRTGESINEADGANPAEPIVTKDQCLAEPAQAMCDTEDIERALAKVKIYANLEGVNSR